MLGMARSEGGGGLESVRKAGLKGIAHNIQQNGITAIPD